MMDDREETTERLFGQRQATNITDCMSVSSGIPRDAAAAEEKNDDYVRAFLRTDLGRVSTNGLTLVLFRSFFFLPLFPSFLFLVQMNQRNLGVVAREYGVQPPLRQLLGKRVLARTFSAYQSCSHHTRLFREMRCGHSPIMLCYWRARKFFFVLFLITRPPSSSPYSPTAYVP
jgi:hypothetical protein